MMMDLSLSRPQREAREEAPSPGRNVHRDDRREIRLKDDAPVILHVDPPSFVAEQYRSLAAQIEERVNPIGAWGYALTVTSPEEGAGKTLTSLNLALTLTRGQERKVLLVEADLWRPQLQAYFADDLTPHPGLHQVLERALPLAEAVVQVGSTSLEVLPAGTSRVAGDKMAGRRMSEVLAEARAGYEIVVLDSPPMALLASARSLAARSDGVVLVVRANQTKKKSIEKTLAALGPEKLVGVVLNGVRISKRGYRGYY